MTERSVIAESLANQGFFVPRHEIRIDGTPLLGGVLRDVIELRYKDSITEIDSAEIVVNNWDADANRFKFIGSEESAEPQDSSEGESLDHLFDPCNKTVEIRMGYSSDLKLMMRGQFTTMEPSFGAAGPVLRVRALNELHFLRRKQYSYAWSDMRDSDIALDLGQLPHPTLDGPSVPRFPVEIEVDDNARGEEPVLPHVIQRNQYDIDFLLERARRRGYVVFLKPNGKLYFGPSLTRAEPPVYRLKWGVSLIDFNPRLTTANQIRAVVANYWDRRGKQLLEVRVDLQTDPDIADLNADLNTMIEQCDPREEQVVDEPFQSEEEARQAARDILRDQRKAVVEASGTTIGLPELRAGSKFRIEGLGARCGGLYFCTESEHVLGENGYITRFKARREEVRA